MAAKQKTRSSSRKTVARAMATRKSSVRAARKAPKVGKATWPPEYIEIF